MIVLDTALDRRCSVAGMAPADPIYATLECIGIRSPTQGGPMLYRASALGHTIEAVEPMRPLCRLLAYHLHAAGPIAFHDVATGRLRMTYAKLEESARWSEGEGDRGFRRGRWKPHPKAPAWEHELSARFRSRASTPDAL